MISPTSTTSTPLEKEMRKLAESFLQSKIVAKKVQKNVKKCERCNNEKTTSSDFWKTHWRECLGVEYTERMINVYKIFYECPTNSYHITTIKKIFKYEVRTPTGNIITKDNIFEKNLSQVNVTIYYKGVTNIFNHMSDHFIIYYKDGCTCIGDGFMIYENFENVLIQLFDCLNFLSKMFLKNDLKSI